MFRAIPTGSKVLTKKWNERNDELLGKRIKNIRPMIDNTCPSSFGIQKKLSKREKLIEDRYTEIEKDNRHLLERMSQIMNNRAQSCKPKTHSVKSLNLDSRKRSLISITLENQAMLKRLRSKKAVYSVKKWEEERKNNENILSVICEFPYKLGNSLKIRKTLSETSFKKIRQRGSIDLNIGKPTTSQELLFKKSVVISGQTFVIEIMRGNTHIQIFVIDGDNQRCFNLEMSIKEVHKLIKGENYEDLVKMLMLENDELVLVKNDVKIKEEKLPNIPCPNL